MTDRSGESSSRKHRMSSHVYAANGESFAGMLGVGQSAQRPPAFEVRFVEPTACTAPEPVDLRTDGQSASRVSKKRSK